MALRGMPYVVGLALALALLPAVAVGLQFYLSEGETRCFGESVAPSTKVLGEYTVAAGQGHMPVDIVVRDLVNGNQTLFARTNINHGKYAFVTPVGKGAPKVHVAEMHRKSEHAHREDEGGHRRMHEPVPEHDHAHGHGGEHGHEMHDHDEHHLEHEHEHEHDHHSHHGDHDEDDHDTHEREQHHERMAEREYLRHVERNKLDELDHMDAHDGKHDDMRDEWDVADYDGLDEDALEKEWEAGEGSRKAEAAAEPAAGDEPDRAFEARMFEICVASTTNSHAALRRRVRLVLRTGRAAHDYTRLAKSEHMSSLQLTLQVVHDELKELHAELDRARQMEGALRMLNESTNARVVRFAVLSLFVLAVVGAAQATYTRRFFKHKKLL